MNFREFLQSRTGLTAVNPTDDNSGSQQSTLHPSAESTPGTGAGGSGSPCSYCGGTYFEPPEDNGRVQRIECEKCGGTMVSHDGGYWQPDLIGQPENHPDMNADPRSGGVGGIGNAPVKVREEDLSSRTAGANGELPEGLTTHLREYQPGDDEHTDLNSHLPGWSHRLLTIHEKDHPVGHLEYSANEDHVKIHETRVHQDYRRRGLATEMNEVLRSMHPRHTIDRGSATEDGEAFRHSLGGVDWCRHRHSEHCWLPRNDSTERGFAVYTPQDRGVCPWTTASQQQINCPVSEAGPMAGMGRAGVMITARFGNATHLTWDEIGERHPHIYGNEDIHGEKAAGGDGEGIGWAANQLAYSRPDDPDAEGSSVHDLEFHEAHVEPRHIDWAVHARNDPRVTEAEEGYRRNPHKVPPLVLVHRHGVYQVADGHHRAQGAAGTVATVRAYVAHSPYPDEPSSDGNGGFSKGPYHGADPSSPHARTASWQDPSWRFHVLATWADVRAKAQRIRSSGGVVILSALVDGITGNVRGDTGIYESQINYVPGTFKVGYWQCGCAWSSFAWGRAPAYRRFEGRLCSHALALQFEAQSRGMFGRQVTEDTQRPGWMRDQIRVRHDRQTREHDVREARRAGLDPDGVYPAGHDLDLERSPIHAFAVEAYRQRHDPADVLRVFLAAGIEPADARRLLEATLSGHAVIEVEVNLGATGSKKKITEPTHAGVALKATDTGRVLMIQRSHRDKNDPAAGLWEFPGGSREKGDHNSLMSAIREFEEEVGHEFPTGGHVSHVWQSPDGVYQGHVVVIPNENVVDFSQGRHTVNPDDLPGSNHEQSAWWHPDDARKNPALRPECRLSPWGEIKKASCLATHHVSDYSAHDGLGDFQPDWRPKAPPRAPDPGQPQNPGSTGWATGQDPSEWDNATSSSETLSLQVDGELHDEPEPALPNTTADEGEDDEGSHYRSRMSPAVDPMEDLSPNDGRTASVTDIVTRFQMTAGGRALAASPRSRGAGADPMDIATAARNYLGDRGVPHTALKNFSHLEQQALITEGDGRTARNFGGLDIAGTHYELVAQAMAREALLGDPEELFR